VFQTKVDTSVWKDVFGDRGPLVFKEGQWVFADTVYCSLRSVVSKSREFGQLESNTRPTIITEGTGAYDGSNKKTTASDLLSAPSTLTASTSDWVKRTYTVFGYYNTLGSYLIAGDNQRGYLATSDPAGKVENTYYGPELIQAVSWGNRGYDPDSQPASTVFFTAGYELRPNMKMFQYSHAWHYEKYGVQDWGPIIGYPFEHYPIKRTEERLDPPITIGWEVLNYYCYNTYQITVEIGAEYNWQPVEPDSNAILTPPSRETGANIFPVVTGGTQAGGVILGGTLSSVGFYIGLFFAIFGLYVGWGVISRVRSKQGIIGMWLVKRLAFGAIYGLIFVGVWFIITLIMPLLSIFF
jgi:hypothetical protein